MPNIQGLESFYNLFHKGGSLQYKVIGRKNFTYRNVLEVLNTFEQEKKRVNVLDFGCGVGTISLYIADSNKQVIGVDVSPEAVELARENAKNIGISDKVKFYTLRTWNTSKYKNNFDMAISIEVIEHVQEDEKMLTMLHQCLKKNGKLIISTPSKNAPLYKLGLADEFDFRVGHLRRYTVSELTSKIQNAGFTIDKVYRFEGIIRNSLFIVPFFGKFVRFVRGPISDFISLLDKLTIPLFGESDIYICATKK